MVSLPPGITYLSHNLPSLVVPPVTLALSIKVVENHTDLNLPVWAIIVLSALSLPAAFTAKTLYRSWKDAKDAAANNAILVPAVPNKLPGGLDLLQTTLDNLENGYPGEEFAQWCEDLGSYTINVKVLYEDRIFTADPNHIKAVLSSQFENFEKGPLFRGQMEKVLGTGVINADGEMWKFHRGMTRPFFSKDRISDFDLFDRHATEALNLLRSRLREGFPVDIQDLTSRFTMDSATEFLFSQEVHSLGAGLPYPHYSHLALASEARDHPANQFSWSFDQAQRQLAMRLRKGLLWPLWEFWKDETKEYMVVINEFMDPILSTAVQRKKESKDAVNADREVKEGESLLDYMIKYTADETVLRDETLNILMAGRDTTMHTITYATYMLSQHPEALKRLRQEVLEMVGETQRPTFQHMKDMKYLRAVINETLRLYPAVPFNMRSTNRPVVFPGKNGAPSYFLPTGTKVNFSVFVMHRRKDLWGPDANEFDPDRFLDERVKTYITPNPFIFLPFNAGPRICLGQQFSYNEISFFLIRLLQQFDNFKHVPAAQPPSSIPPPEWKNATGTQSTDGMKIKSYLTMSASGGCWLTMDEIPNKAE